MRILKTIIYLTLAIVTNALAFLDDEAQEIPPAIINANDTSTSEITTNDNMMVITQQQIQNSGAVTISQILRNQAGIQLNDLFGDNSQVSVSIRGFGDNAANNSLILVDGFSIVNPDIAVPQLNSIPIETIERIEILPGSPAVLYGDQAVGGIINIITKQPLQFTGDLLTGAGSYDNALGNLFTGDTFANNINYAFDGEINGTKNYRSHNNQNRENLWAKLGYTYNTGDVMFRLQRYHDFLQFAGALTAQQVQDDPQQAQNTTDFSDQLFELYQAQLKQNINQNWLAQINVSRNSNLTDGTIFSPFFQQRVVNQINPRIIGDLNNNIFTGGIDIETDQYNFNSILLHDNDDLQQYGVYAQLLIPFAKYFKATFGGRDEEQFTHLNNSTTPQNSTDKALVSETSLSYQIKPDWRLYISREGNFRFPKVDENAFIPTGTTALKTQTGVSYETGAEWLRFGRDFKITFYQLNLRDEIAFNPLPTPTEPFGSNVNLPPTRRNGFVLSSHYPLFPNFVVGTDYGYVDAFFLKGSFNNKQIPFVAKHIVNLNADYNFLPHWDLYAEELYTGNRFASADFQNINGKLAGYALTNLNLQYQRKHWIFSARVNNLFNKKYNAFVVFNPEIMQNFFYPAPGINFLVTGEYQV